MPKRKDIKKIFIIGSGPIIVGQGSEFDYSGVQACKALVHAGYELVVLNSNPATIMTDLEQGYKVYIKPINWQFAAEIIASEKPDALLATLGGQTALNCALELQQRGILADYKVELLGASIDAINKAENRLLFYHTMAQAGIELPKTLIAYSFEQALELQVKIGFPLIMRNSFCLGGEGSGIVYDFASFEEKCLANSKEGNFARGVLLEESLLGWKEIELEVIRDRKDNCLIVCGIENFTPMGVHTGDSITVAPVQTLTDKEYQNLRNTAFKVLREVGLEAGGANVQFAVNPVTGRQVLIEMNPRVSRSSALASKATGFPIAKVAALLAVGFALDEIESAMVGANVPISFEPTIDYVVCKIPRFDFAKFPQLDAKVTTQMKSTGEVIGIGKTFIAAFQKGLASVAKDNFNNLTKYQEVGGMDAWFLAQIKELECYQEMLANSDIASLTKLDWLFYKRKGFPDKQMAELLKTTELEVRKSRLSHGVRATFNKIDSGSAEFAVNSSSYYSNYAGYCERQADVGLKDEVELESEVELKNKGNNKRILILGSGPNRIGQGIEFDYCCVHAALALKEQGYEVIMLNCNPGTVSTDLDLTDRLYLEPLTLEHVLNVIAVEKPMGVIAQFGGQTALNLAKELAELQKMNSSKELDDMPFGISALLGTGMDMIGLAEDRSKFSQLLTKLNLLQPQNLEIRINNLSIDDLVFKITTSKLNFPLIVRPSYVLGGQAMKVICDIAQLKAYLQDNKAWLSLVHTLLVEEFIEDAIEIDLDLIRDTQGEVLIAGIMQHLEPGGIHSGDSACCMPPHDLSVEVQQELAKQAKLLAAQLQIVGLLNIQFLVKGSKVYVLEANPRASRTVPFVTKATDYPLAKIAAKCMLGVTLKAQSIDKVKDTRGYASRAKYAIKQPVFSFANLLDSKLILGPEMKSTGEVMAVADTFEEAYGLSRIAVEATSSD